MKKKMIILPILSMLLTSCSFSFGSFEGFSNFQSSSSSVTQQSSSTMTESSDIRPIQYGVEILNKVVLQQEGFYNSTSRELEIALSPEANVLQEIYNGNLTIASSDTSVIALNGLVLTAISEGSATIKVKYYDAFDTVTINTAGEQRAPDPISATCEEVMSADDTAGGNLYIGWGYLVDWGRKTSANEYGELGLGDRPDTTKADSDYMYVYGSFVEPGVDKTGFFWDGSKFVKDYNRDFLTNDLTKDLRIGDRVQFLCIRADYGTTKEVIAQILAVEKSSDVEATSVTLDTTSLNLYVGATTKLNATVEPVNCNVEPTWTSSNPNVATVNDDGLVSALNEGETIITIAYSDSVRAECYVRVEELADNEYIVSSSILNLGRSYTPEIPYSGTVKGVKFVTKSVADYGDGMQFCKLGHNTYEPGTLYNTTPFDESVISITFYKSHSKLFYDNHQAFSLELADNPEFIGASVEYIDTIADVEQFTYNPQNSGTYMRLTVNVGYTLYFSSIKFTTGTFNIDEGDEEQPDENDATTKTFETSYINQDSGGESFTIWTEGELLHTPEGWNTNGWRLYLVFDSEGDLAYGVYNPVTGYGNPTEASYLRHEKYANYLDNPSIEILEGFGPWVPGGTAHNQFNIVVPAGGFALTSYGDMVGKLLSALFGYVPYILDEPSINMGGHSQKFPVSIQGGTVTFNVPKFAYDSISQYEGGVATIVEQTEDVLVIDFNPGNKILFSFCGEKISKDNIFGNFFNEINSIDGLYFDNHLLIYNGRTKARFIVQIHDDFILIREPSLVEPYSTEGSLISCQSSIDGWELTGMGTFGAAITTEYKVKLNGLSFSLSSVTAGQEGAYGFTLSGVMPYHDYAWYQHGIAFTFWPQWATAPTQTRFHIGVNHDNTIDSFAYRTTESEAPTGMHDAINLIMNATENNESGLSFKFEKVDKNWYKLTLTELFDRTLWDNNFNYDFETRTVFTYLKTEQLNLDEEGYAYVNFFAWGNPENVYHIEKWNAQYK